MKPTIRVLIVEDNSFHQQSGHANGTIVGRNSNKFDLVLTDVATTSVRTLEAFHSAGNGGGCGTLQMRERRIHQPGLILRIPPSPR